MKVTKYKNGFTLIEVMIAVILIGLAIASLVGANSVFTQANGAGTELSTGEFLLEQIKELTAMLPFVDPNGYTPFGPESGETVTHFDDLGDFDNFDSSSLGGPIDAGRNILTNFSSFRQQVTVQNVNPSNFEQVISDSSTANFIRITVKVFNNSKEICSASWLRTRY